jgi:serine/threonine protein phosphatase PrpC
MMCRVLRAFGVTNKGRVRATNEDYFAIDEDVQLLVVADGMGGHNAGEVASRIAVDAVVEFVREHVRHGAVRSRSHVGAESAALNLNANQLNANQTWPFGPDPALSEGGNLLRTGIHLANVQILEAAATAEEYAGMGTTVVAALVAGDRLSVAHVGDSRAYLAANGRIRQLTPDDSWLATLLAQNPEADPAILRHHPMRSALTNVVGGRPRIEIHVIDEKLLGGERLLLSTDGVHGVLDEDHLRTLLLDGADLAEAPGTLVSTALARGSRDNCTAIVAEYVRQI